MIPNPPGLEYTMSVHLHMVPDSLVQLPEIPGGGGRWSINVAGGSFSGPELRGRVLPGGIENPHFRPNKSLMINARWLLEEEDGTVIYVQNRGIRRGHEPGAMDAWLDKSRPTTADDFYFRVVPTFEVGPGKHEWLAENIFVGMLGDTPAELAGPTPGPTMHYFRVR